jgi:hypothetical protein
LPLLEKLLGSGWSKSDENVMGEFGWKEVLKQFLDDTRAKTLAAAWGGDKYALYEEKQSKRIVLVTRLHLDSEEHATRFSGQYSEALEKKYSDRSNLFRRPKFFSFDGPDGGVFLYCFGAECVTMEGTTRKVFDGLTKAIDWPMAPQPSQRLESTAPAKTTMIFGFAENNFAASDVALSLQFFQSQGFLIRTANDEKRQIVRLLQSLPKDREVFETFGD